MDPLIDFVEAMDRCWIERRFDDLAAMLADDIAIVAPDGVHRATGSGAAVDSYRGFMTRCAVQRFAARDHVVTRHGTSAVVEYRWDMAWDEDGTSHEATGREILALADRGDGWRAYWRMQLPG